MPKQQTDGSRKRGSSYQVLTMGYAILVLAVVGIAIDLLQRRFLSLPVDIGVIFGGAAFAVAGLVAVVVGAGLRVIEDRLDEIERK